MALGESHMGEELEASVERESFYKNETLDLARTKTRVLYGRLRGQDGDGLTGMQMIISRIPVEIILCDARHEVEGVIMSSSPEETWRTGMLIFKEFTKLLGKSLDPVPSQGGSNQLDLSLESEIITIALADTQLTDQPSPFSRYRDEHHRNIELDWHSETPKASMHIWPRNEEPRARSERSGAEAHMAMVEGTKISRRSRTDTSNSFEKEAIGRLVDSRVNTVSFPQNTEEHQRPEAPPHSEAQPTTIRQIRSSDRIVVTTVQEHGKGRAHTRPHDRDRDTPSSHFRMTG
ncbi:hypothetical protein R1sor_010752 [Riccia sorocarpa]|uniref:Uncharacterized protein n=1 Tax=Riccia sorocarpa TaxID=122646 RepID=A0ABD3I0C7_9MARC